MKKAVLFIAAAAVAICSITGALLASVHLFVLPKAANFAVCAIQKATEEVELLPIQRILWSDEPIEKRETTWKRGTIKKPWNWEGLQTDPPEEPAQKISLGFFGLTAYCSCQLCCGEYAIGRPVDENGNEIVYGAIGERLTPGYSVAVDPSVIPYGSEIEINGNVYCAQDCGGGIVGNRIDIYFSDHQEALQFGVGEAEVFLILEE